MTVVWNLVEDSPERAEYHLPQIVREARVGGFLLQVYRREKYAGGGYAYFIRDTRETVGNFANGCWECGLPPFVDTPTGRGEEFPDQAQEAAVEKLREYTVAHLARYEQLLLDLSESITRL